MTASELHADMRGRSTRRIVRQAVLTGCLALTCANTAVHADTLKQVVETALKTHPRALAAEAEKRAATQDLSQARSGYLPTLDLSVSGGREHTESPVVRGATGSSGATLDRQEAGVVLSQNLYAGGATMSEVERQNARLKAAASRLDEVREDLALRTTNIYLEVIKNRELVKLATESLKAHLDTQSKVQLRVKGGVSQKADLQQAQGRVALARSTLVARAGNLREVEAVYKTLVGQPPKELVDPQAKATDLVKSGGLDRSRLSAAILREAEAALASNPTLIAANADVAAAEASVRGAKAPYFPRINLELNSNRNRNVSGLAGEFNNDSAMLVLRWNLFRGGGDYAQEKALAERRYAAIDTAANTQRDVEERVARALHAKATSEERLTYLREHASLSADVLESYKQQLDLGRRTLLDVLNAENEVFTARSNLAAGRYEDLYNQYVIEAAKGLLVMSLGIAPAE